MSAIARHADFIALPKGRRPGGLQLGEAVRDRVEGVARPPRLIVCHDELVRDEVVRHPLAREHRVGGKDGQRARINDRNFEVAVFGRNLTNERKYIQNLLVAPLGYATSMRQEPRTYGISGTVKF